MIRNIRTIGALFAFVALSAGSLSAQTAAADAGTGVTTKTLVTLLIFATIAVALVSLLLTVTVLVLVRARQTEAVAALQAQALAKGLPAEQVAALAPAERKPVLSWSHISKKLTDAVPIEKEADIDLGHDYDGIRELDNSLPPWWKWGFYITIGYAAIYLVVFHLTGDWSSKQEYDDEVALAEVQKQEYLKTAANLVDESSVTMLSDAAALASGKEIYTANCAVCHGAEGQGGIGPNMTDAYWIHGGSVGKVFATIKYGVPAKGMIPWEGTLKPQQIQQVASYILSLQGTNPPNPKAPEGQPETPDAAPKADSAAQKTVASAEAL
ncbi:MAG: cbb3-type cytochrome c oxidase N-terminal domain-containing protein [Bacteroidia bacterium]|nr:cbb3-type cytochrome c oxidase N-terminal domain-containing protein [Bacteroidia bacterium]